MGNTVGSQQQLSPIQREIIIGTTLGDAYLQPTGSENARLRIEHSKKQSFYVEWKYQQFEEFVTTDPRSLSRENQKFGGTYNYRRFQTVTLRTLGKFREEFYEERTKIVPENINSLLNSRFSLAVWYMDDGYLDSEGKNSFIYLSKYTVEELKRLQECLRENFGLDPKIKVKKGGSEISLYFCAKETEKLLRLVAPFVLDGFAYKIVC